MLSRIQERYRKSNKVFLALRFILTVFVIYFAVRVLVISISGLTNSIYSTNYPGYLTFGMIFSLALSYVVQLIEMLVSNKKEHFTLLLITTIIMLGVSACLLWFAVNS
ncbi:hypothetical protein DFR57_1145 [Saliterribacillus persicus]|uniref:Uncharacterized protein n=2 Tax=Saliterribacillus persicus TaxID=930114 RepID=A0A368X917_9BACI|nr:hypothetical protein DFR57_1145 [Saliterribacillus persicus]